jgi:hypothetical protein
VVEVPVSRSANPSYIASPEGERRLEENPEEARCAVRWAAHTSATSTSRRREGRLGGRLDDVCARTT